MSVYLRYITVDGIPYTIGRDIEPGVLRLEERPDRRYRTKRKKAVFMAGERLTPWKAAFPGRSIISYEYEES